jgi:hypothetical protein
VLKRQGGPVTSKVVLTVAEDEADDVRLDEISRQLRDVLLQTDVDAVEPYAAGEAPPGAKGETAMVAGALVATVGAMPLQQLLGLVVHWLKSGRTQRSVRLEVDGDVIVVRGIDDETQQQLMQRWLDRHPADVAPST